MQDKKMFKVISPIERRDGTKWWMRCGSAHMNKDLSINVYVDALPLASMTPGKGVTLQIREYTEQELRERSERNASYGGNGGNGGGNGRREAFGANGLPIGAPHGGPHGSSHGSSHDGPGESIPF